MKYPKFIKKNDKIAVTAPSLGFSKEEQIIEYDNAIKNIENMGFRFIETENVRTCENGRSSSTEERAEQFMNVWNNDEVSAIICAKGGDFACEVLDFLDFERIKKSEPKWVQGFSDITNLGFLLTTNCDIATIYGENIRDYGMKSLHKSLIDSIKIMQGEEILQESFEFCEPINEEREIFESYHLVQKACWKTLDNKPVHFSGRCVGGCFDVIINIIGTKYDKINEYIDKYKNDGIVWFFDIFEMSTPQIFCHLWQMKNAGYFENCNGIIFGRPFMVREDYDISLEMMVKEIFKEKDIPIVFDGDIGHIPPQMPIVNGGILEVTCKNGKGTIKNFFR